MDSSDLEVGVGEQAPASPQPAETDTTPLPSPLPGGIRLSEDNTVSSPSSPLSSGGEVRSLLHSNLPASDAQSEAEADAGAKEQPEENGRNDASLWLDTAASDVAQTIQDAATPVAKLTKADFRVGSNLKHVRDKLDEEVKHLHKSFAPEHIMFYLGPATSGMYDVKRADMVKKAKERLPTAGELLTYLQLSEAAYEQWDTAETKKGWHGCLHRVHKKWLVKDEGKGRKLYEKRSAHCSVHEINKFLEGIGYQVVAAPPVLWYMHQQATLNVGLDLQPNAQGQLDVGEVRQWLEKELGVKVESQGPLYVVDEGVLSEDVEEVKGDTLPAPVKTGAKVTVAMEARTVQMAANHVAACCLGDGDPYAGRCINLACTCLSAGSNCSCDRSEVKHAHVSQECCEFQDCPCTSNQPNCECRRGEGKVPAHIHQGGVEEFPESGCCGLGKPTPPKLWGADMEFLLVYNAATEELVLSFRGTASGEDVMTDLDGCCSCQGFNIMCPCLSTDRREVFPRAHPGMYYKCWKPARERVMLAILEAKQDIDTRYPGKQVKLLTVTGHSLGGALATYAASEIGLRRTSNDPEVKDQFKWIQDLQMITFGQPRAVVAEWTFIMDQVVPRAVRVVNSWDIVPRLPHSHNHPAHLCYLVTPQSWLQRVFCCAWTREKSFWNPSTTLIWLQFLSTLLLDLIWPVSLIVLGVGFLIYALADVYNLWILIPLWIPITLVLSGWYIKQALFNAPLLAHLIGSYAAELKYRHERRALCPCGGPAICCLDGEEAFRTDLKKSSKYNFRMQSCRLFMMTAATLVLVCVFLTAVYEAPTFKCCDEVEDCNPCNKVGDDRALCLEYPFWSDDKCKCSRGFTFQVPDYYQFTGQVASCYLPSEFTTCSETDISDGNPCNNYNDYTAQCVDRQLERLPYYCSCGRGYQFSMDTFISPLKGFVTGETCTAYATYTCAEADPVASNPCVYFGDQEATCQDGVAANQSYTCRCSSNYNYKYVQMSLGQPSETCVEKGIYSCETVDPRTKNPCNNFGDNNATCHTYGAGYYYCQCSRDYMQEYVYFESVQDYAASCAPFFAYTCARADSYGDNNPCNNKGDTGAICHDHVDPYMNDTSTMPYYCSCSCGYTYGREQLPGLISLSEVCRPLPSVYTCSQADIIDSNPCNDYGDTNSTCVDGAPGNSYSCTCSLGYSCQSFMLYNLEGGPVPYDPYNLDPVGYGAVCYYSA